MRTSQLIPVLFGAALVAKAAASGPLPTPDTYPSLALYSEAMTIIHDQYVDPLPWTKLVDDGIGGMLESLNADDALLSKQESEKLEAAPAPGDVGIVLGRRDTWPAIIATSDGTPARAAGLRSGDLIQMIDGMNTQGVPPRDVAVRLRGQPGTTVALTVSRAGWPEPKAVALTRAKQPEENVTARNLGAGVVYIRIPVIRDRTAWEVGQILSAPPGDHATGLILDLRDTAGGQPPAAVAIAGMLLDAGSIVTRVETRVPSQPRELLAPAESGPHDVPIAVIVNHGTESAAEILAGALQDSKRAVIVGSPTFGDASKQSTIPLPGGRTLYLTTGRYLTPKGRVISGHGIAPDLTAGTLPPAGLTPLAATAKGAAMDPEVKLAFDTLKAAHVLEHSSAQTTAPEPQTKAIR